MLERLAAVAGGAEAAGLYLRAADIYEQKLNRKDRAVLCCQMASRAEPRERQSFQRARHLLLSENRYLPAFESLERERGVLGDRDMADEYVAFAEKIADDPTEHPLAIRALDVATQIDPKNARADKVRKEIAKFEHTWRDKIRT